MFMDKKKFYEAINMIDDDLIKEAEIKPEKLVKADTGAEDSGMTVSGVELYSSKIKWRRIAATAAMFVLAAGIGAVGYNVFRQRTPVVKEETELATESDSTDEVSTKESNDKKEAESETTSAQKSEKTTAKTTEKSTSAASEKKDTEQTSKTDKNQQTAETVVKVTVQQTEKPTETQKPKTTSKTTAKTTTKTTTTKRTESATTTKAPAPSEKMDVFARLNELTYSPETCDGLPEYVLNAPGDTEIFYFNFSGYYKWVWRNSSTSNPVQMEAVLPDDLAEYLMEHGEEIGMYPSQYSIPVPMQGYSFNAQYIRTNGYSDGAVYPKKKLITSRAELDSYIEANKDIYDFKGWDTITGFMNATAKYDDSWFSSHKLLVVVLEEGSGSISHTVAEVNGLGVTIQREIPEVGTCDEAEWHILIEVDKDVYVHSDFMVSTYEKHIR